MRVAQVANIVTLVSALGVAVGCWEVFSTATTFAQYSAGQIILAMTAALSWMFYDGLKTLFSLRCRGAIYVSGLMPTISAAIFVAGIIVIMLLHFSLLAMAVMVVANIGLASRAGVR